MASLDELQAAVLGIPGVIGADVAASETGPPAVRVWTDNSRDPEELRAEVRSVVARAYRRGLAGESPHVIREPDDAKPNLRPVESPPLPPGRRSGLGRGLDELFRSTDEEEPEAASPSMTIDLTAKGSLDTIAIEESAAGVTVRAIDSARRVAEAKVIGGAASVNQAIVSAVAELVGEQPAPQLISVELRDSKVATVLVVTLERADATVTAGAAVVEGGMPFTLGKATWVALA